MMINENVTAEAQRDLNEALDTLMNPAPEDVIVLTLAGEDEATDAGVELADRIVADLAASGFVIVPRAAHEPVIDPAGGRRCDYELIPGNQCMLLAEEHDVRCVTCQAWSPWGLDACPACGATDEEV